MSDEESDPAPSETVLVLITYPDEENPSANAFAEQLIERNLAACVNVLSEVNSFFHWDGDLQEAEESLLIAKTSEATYPDLETCVMEQHPYDEPEVIGLSLDRGSDAYLQWVQEALNAS